MKIYFRKEFALAALAVVSITIVALDLIFVHYWAANAYGGADLQQLLVNTSIFVALVAVAAVFALTKLHEIFVKLEINHIKEVGYEE